MLNKGVIEMSQRILGSPIRLESNPRNELQSTSQHSEEIAMK